MFAGPARRSSDCPSEPAAANDAGSGNQFEAGRVLPALCGANPGEAQIVARRARTLPFDADSRRATEAIMRWLD